MFGIAIVGGGIAGLTLALQLQARGIKCCVYESAPQIRELGVGITLLPHALKVLSSLGLAPALEAAGIENRESRFYNRFGQLILSEPRGRFAGYLQPEIGIRRGVLHGLLYRATLDRLGPDCIRTDRKCVDLEQDDRGVTLHFVETSSDARAPSVRADAVVACDGVNSMVRRCFYPDEDLAFAGINTWRGITRRKPILDGRTYLRIGSLRTGRMVIYPVADNIDEEGNQLINWFADIQSGRADKNDWNKPGRIEDFAHTYKEWRYDWLDVPDLIARAELVLEYPMVDKDPVNHWTFGRVTFAGDAAHPMYPRGSNGAAQALLDVHLLSDLLAKQPIQQAFLAYEALRLPQTSRVVQTNRTSPPDAVIARVDDLTGDKPFDNLDSVVSREELRSISERYKSIAGFSLDDLRGSTS